MPDDTDTTSYRTVAEAVEELRLPSLRRLIAQGRVPFIVNVGCAWMLPKESITFLKRSYKQGKRFGGHAGNAKSRRMRRRAAQLDPDCAKRQAAWDKLYPNGAHNGAAKMSKPKKKSRKRS